MDFFVASPRVCADRFLPDSACIRFLSILSGRPVFFE
jgi:hypothetical protein